MSSEFRIRHGTQPVHVPIANSLKSSVCLSKHNATPSVKPPSMGPIPGSDELKVIVSLTLAVDARLPVTMRWVNYLTTHVPSFIEKGEVTIEGVYRSASCVVKVMMPIAIWRCPTPDSALRNDSLVDGHNLIPQLPAAVRRRQERRSDESEKTLTVEEEGFEH